MNKKMTLFLLFLSLTLCCLVLFMLGSFSIAGLSGNRHLEMQRPEPQQIKVGEGTIIDLYGHGFDADITAHLVMNIADQRGTLLSFPVEGVFNESLRVDDILYLGSNQNGLLAINVANPLEPRLIGEYLTGVPILDIQQKADLLYLACGRSGVVIMQVERSGELVPVVNVPVNSLAAEICLIGDFIAVAAGADGLLLYEFSSTQDLVLTKRIDVGARVTAIESSADFIYLATQKKTLEVFSFARGKIEHFSSIEVSDNPKALSLFHGNLFVAIADQLERFDLAVPGIPQPTGVIDSFGSADKIICGEKRLYVVDSFMRLSVVDPLALEIVNTVDFTAHIRTLTEVDDYLFVAGAGTGLQVFDRDLSGVQSAIKLMNTAGSSHDLVVIENWIYVADKRGGVLLKNIQRDKDTFTQVSSHNAESFYLDERRKLLFVALGRSGIEVMDVSDPGHPQTVAFWPELQASKIAVSGDDLIFSRGAYGIALVNSHNLNNPIVKQILPDLHVLDLYVAGNVVYVASNRKGLQIYIIKDEKLKLISETVPPFPMNQFAHTVAVSVVDEIAYVANGRSGLMLVDVRNHNKTKILGLIDIPGFAKKISKTHGKVFVSSQSGGVTIVNIDNPRHPHVESYIPLNAVSRGLQVVDGLIYVSQLNAGVSAIPVPLSAVSIDYQSSDHVRVSFPSSRFMGSYGIQVRNCTDAFFFDDVVVVGE